ncbi:transcriptional regulator [Frondihabitans sp. PAMC 28766]|uniref:GAF and ANTAR domain-containing protein n=1 Tax=Frondihabitans sp. PAMC 28766 TaxID=1795630 RepID=UPI00078DDC0E|nr:GAF and ANTAR domain-containing protein [Frondihabitans sp. PAMC 28766]AMM22054.1 transcriptional regulator [Frondihabitans sp. PAMC 28766]
MTESSREAQLLETFVTLADSLVVGFDVLDLLQTLVDRCTVLFPAKDAGILLASSTGELEVVVSTSERSRLVGLLQLGADEGPCVEAYTSSKVVTVVDAAEITRRWPTFAARSVESGYQSVHAVPLRLRGTSLGSLNLFSEVPGALDEGDTVAIQALTDVATISILQERALRETSVAREQLQRALDSRIIIEQAKGVISYTHDIDMDAAFRLIREYARSNRVRLSDVAEGIVRRSLTV